MFVTRFLTKFHITLGKSFIVSGSMNKKLKIWEIPISCVTVYKYVHFMTNSTPNFKVKCNYRFFHPRNFQWLRAANIALTKLKLTGRELFIIG